MERLHVSFLRNTEMIIYGWRSRPEDDELKSYWYSMMWCERKYSCLLKLIGTFMGNAPQFVLQLYIIGRFGAENDTLLCKLYCVYILLFYVVVET